MINADAENLVQESARILSDVKAAGAERLKQGGPKLGFVYTSGTWVHGTSKKRCSDLDPVGTEDAGAPPARMVLHVHHGITKESGRQRMGSGQESGQAACVGDVHERTPRCNERMPNNKDGSVSGAAQWMC